MLIIIADYYTAYTIGYWIIPVLLGIWAIVMVAKKILQGIKDTKEIDKKLKN